ncbi:MAG: CpsD/CapB family tyrosine-protein kinase [Chloroflexi bacterium]|nr:CpsD/CapB family tyrosine-protein kinase [Chloroflexota bacterium]
MSGVSDTAKSGTGLVMIQAPRSAAAEAYRSLSTNIRFSSLDQDVKTLLVTSVAPNEGKTVVLANLAAAMAESGRRIVAVDCDLRRPTLHGLFGLTDTPGLTSMVLDEGLAPPLQATGLSGVSVVAAGPPPPNPSELLASARFGRALDTIAAQGDVILLDAAPVTSVSDAAILAARVDGVLLVVDSGRTRRDPARRAREQLERVGARLLGVVLTNVKAEKGQNDYLSVSK